MVLAYRSLANRLGTDKTHELWQKSLLGIKALALPKPFAEFGILKKHPV